MSPDQIIASLLHEIHSVEASESYFLLKPTEKLTKALGRQPPVMLLFGEDHSSGVQCETCDPKNHCYSLFRQGKFSLLQYLNNMKDLYQTDVFVEKDFDTTSKLEPFKHKKKNKKQSAMIEIRETHANCMRWDKAQKVHPYGCAYPDIRMHMEDIRSVPDDSNYAEFFPTVVTNAIIDERSLPYSKAFQHFLDVMFPGIKTKELVDLYLHRLTIGPQQFYTTIFWHHPFFQKYSKVYKQLRWLPHELLHDIKQYDMPLAIFPQPKIEKLFLKLQDNDKDEKLALHHLIQAINLFAQNVGWDDIHLTFARDLGSWLGVNGPDLYFLGRALKVPEGSRPSQLCVLIAGGAHVETIVNFLLSFGWYSCVSHEQNKGLNKCHTNIRQHDANNPHTFSIL